MEGLYERLSKNVSTLDKRIYSKSSLIGISHAIEDIVMNFNLKAEMYVFFQEFKFFIFEKDKYLKLDKMCEKIFIFARNIRYDEVSDFTNTIFVELRPDSPFCDEWNVIVCHPDHSMVFSSSELYEFNILAEDSLRKFTGFLSFSPEIASQAAKLINKALKDYGHCYTPVYYDVRMLTEKEHEFNQKVNFFINRTLNEIEENSEAIINKNLILSSALKENNELSLEILKRLCYAAEYRDEDSALHLIRMSYYSTRLYSRIISDKVKIKNLNYASLMHDIGKIGIPDSILFKPAALTKEEFEVMKTHCILGANILSGSRKELIQTAEGIALNHHEKWNGSGYPAGKAATEIPLEARVVAIADVFDALLSKRAYKPAYPVEKCVSILIEEKGKHFDGELVELFLGDLDELIKFKNRMDSLSEEVPIKSLFNNYFTEFE